MQFCPYLELFAFTCAFLALCPLPPPPPPPPAPLAADAGLSDVERMGGPSPGWDLDEDMAEEEKRGRKRKKETTFLDYFTVLAALLLLIVSLIPSLLAFVSLLYREVLLLWITESSSSYFSASPRMIGGVSGRASLSSS